MKKLQTYLNGLAPPEQAEFARRSGTTIGYLRKAISKGQRIGEGICINLERESGRAVTCEDIREDVDWAFLRNSGASTKLAEVAGPPNGMERRDPNRISPYVGSDLERRAQAAAGEG
jgi:DNA-binding transcriptional regulator YdaS (Cro superfamily)